MTAPHIVPAYAIVDYIWALLQANNSPLSLIEGRIPIIPVSTQPEFVQQTKPFIVYAWSESPTTPVPDLRSGQISFAIYGTSVRDISQISNIIVSGMNRYDDTAQAVNVWKIGKAYDSIRFTTFWAGAFDGPSPAESEGGRMSAVVMIRFNYITTYDVVLP